MKIPKIDFTTYKELEGKLNTWLVMVANDDEGITLGEIIDFAEVQNISDREKKHLCLSAGIHLGIIMANGAAKMIDSKSNTIFG